MRLIKDYVVLDFLEWLKRNGNEYLFVDRLDYDLKYKHKIEVLAKEYLKDIKRSNLESLPTHPESQFRSILKSFVDSGDFNRLFGHGYCTKDVEERISDFCHVIKFSSSNDLKNELLCYYYRMFVGNDKRIDEINLIDCIKKYFSNNDNFHGKIYCKSEVALIEEFLNYLDARNIKLNIKTIPQKYLKRLVHKYNKTELEDETIVDALKNRINQNMLSVLRRRISDKRLSHYKELGYLYDRYNEDKVQYKCLILPLKGELDLETFISKYWDELDATSKDYLDIFVSKNDIQLSGHRSLEKLSNLISFEEIELPSILIWNKQMDVARSIKIRGVDFAQLYSCLQLIINLIKKEKDIDTIIIDVNSFIARCVEENKQHIVIQQQIKDNHGIIIGLQTETVDFEYLYLLDIQMAMDELETLNLENTLKKRAIGILHNLRKAIKEKNDTEILNCKEKYNRYIGGEGAEVVIDILKKYSYIWLLLGIDETKRED